MNGIVTWALDSLRHGPLQALPTDKDVFLRGPEGSMAEYIPQHARERSAVLTMVPG